MLGGIIHKTSYRRHITKQHRYKALHGISTRRGRRSLGYNCFYVYIYIYAQNDESVSQPSSHVSRKRPSVNIYMLHKVKKEWPRLVQTLNIDVLSQ